MPPKNLVKKSKIHTVGISLRDGFLTPYHVEVLSNFVEVLSKNHKKIIFLSHSIFPSESHNDIHFVKKIFGEKYEVTLSMNETLDKYQEIDVMISMRLHATILAAQNNIPVMMIPYGPKTFSLSKILEIEPFMIAGENFSLESMLHKLSYLEHNFEKMQEKIHTKYRDIHQNFLQKLEKIDMMGL